MEDEEEVSSQSSAKKAATKRAARPAVATGFIVADDPEKLRKDYEAAGKQLNYWFGWGAGLLLLLALALGWWGPHEWRAVPTPTTGYTFHQAGRVRGRGDTTWVWILADTAGRARVLLSADQGRTWLVRDVGLRSSQARALALGWGAPGRGLVVGDSGQVRVLEDVFRAPLQGQSQRLKYLDSYKKLSPQPLFAVAVASDGRSAVILGKSTSPDKDTGSFFYEEGKYYQTTNGATWSNHSLHNGAEGEQHDAYEVSNPTQVVVEPGTPARFQIASAEHFYQLSTPRDTLFTGLLKAISKRSATTNSTAVVAAFAQANKLYSEIMANGTVRRYYRNGIGYSQDFEWPKRDTLLFSFPPNVVTAVPELADSTQALLFVNTPAGGEVHRVPAFGPRLAAIDTALHRVARQQARALNTPQAAR